MKSLTRTQKGKKAIEKYNNCDPPLPPSNLMVIQQHITWHATWCTYMSTVVLLCRKPWRTFSAAMRRFPVNEYNLQAHSMTWSHSVPRLRLRDWGYCNREWTRQQWTNNTTAKEQRNRKRTMQPRTNNATANLHGSIVRLRLCCSLRLRYSFAIVLFVRGCVVCWPLRCSFVVALNPSLLTPVWDALRIWFST